MSLNGTDGLKEQLAQMNHYLSGIYREAVRNHCVALFLDHSNFYHSIVRIRKQMAMKYSVDYCKIKQLLVADRFMLRAGFYYSDHEDVRDSKRDGLHSYLESVGYSLSRHRLVGGGVAGYREKGLDIAIAKDMINMARDTPRCQTMILVSGDGDYLETVEELRHKHGVKVEVAFFGPETSTALRQAAFRFIDLEPLRQDFQLYER